MKLNQSLPIIFFVLISLKGKSLNSLTESNQFIEVNETVELALIVAALSNLDRDSNNSINRQTSYFRYVDAFFGDQRDHQLFKKLGNTFNLPRLVGNAANYYFDHNDKLTLVDGTSSLWNDVDGNLFLNLLDDLNDFALKSNFRQFYRNHQKIYSSCILNTDQLINQKEMLNWLAKEFKTTGKPFKVFVSPLMSGFHWTTLYSPEQRIWINVPDLKMVNEGGELFKLSYARVVFTELDHGYVNPLSDLFSDEINSAMTKLAFWGNTKDAKGYSSAMLKFNEYMTWSVFLLYAKDQTANDKLFEKLKVYTVEMMELWRGFSHFEVFTNESLRLKDDNPDLSAKDIQLHMIDWCRIYEANN